MAGHNFKVGDTAECIELRLDGADLTIGKYYVVQEVETGEDARIMVINNHKEPTRYFIRRFKPVATKEKTMQFTESLKTYISKNQDTFFTVALIIVLDHYLFDGSLRDKLKKSVENLLDKLPS